MNNAIIATLENLEEKIENIKWMLAMRFSVQRNRPSGFASIIRKSSGILGKSFPKGTDFENKARRAWGINSRFRTA